MIRKILIMLVVSIAGGVISSVANDAIIYRNFTVLEADGKVMAIEPMLAATVPLWAKDVSQRAYKWSSVNTNIPYFEAPIPFVIPPEANSGEPFYAHNHQPAITWLPNGDLFAIWYTTESEKTSELTVLASRLRAGQIGWDPAAEFFKATGRNMHGSSLFFDDQTGKLHHLNGMAKESVIGHGNLALLHRVSHDNGVTWSIARPVSSGANYQRRHQVIAGLICAHDGVLIQPCDATSGSEGSSAIHISYDGGETWADPGGDIRGIHAMVIKLTDGRLFAFGRSQAIDGYMPISVSADMGKSWTYFASEFPVIGSGQRLVLMRLREGVLLFISFTNNGTKDRSGWTFSNADGRAFEGVGMYAALSYDEGKTWPVRKLLTPGKGVFDGGAWTRQFEATPNRAEHAGYLAATQTPDGIIHLISSRLHYRFNLKWLETPTEK